MSDSISPVSVLVVVPVYNHAATLRAVVEGCLVHAPVLVVDDGSADLPPARVPPAAPAASASHDPLCYRVAALTGDCAAHTLFPAAPGGIGPAALPIGDGTWSEYPEGNPTAAWRGAQASPPSSLLPPVLPPDAFDPAHPLSCLPALYARHERNRGKGRAILTGAAVARKLGFTHILTVDADGQHDPADIPAFLRAISAAPLALLVGTRDFDAPDTAPNVPGASRFGRAFSNFWYKVQTGKTVKDSQSGFRAYPLAVLDNLSLGESRYGFETEVLVRAAWAGFAVKDVPIRVYYPPRAERVSHFRPCMDNFRLSLLNTRLTVRAVLPVPQKRCVPDGEGGISVLRPLQSLRLLLSANETPRDLALSGGIGVAIGALPIFGLHCITIILALGALGRNKIAGLATSNLCAPPFVPALCIEAGYYLRHGSFLTELSWQTLGREGLERIWEWLLGSLVLGPVLGLACGLVVFGLAHLVRRGLVRGTGETP